MNDNSNKELVKYRSYGLTLLQLMGVLGFIGIAVTVILSYFF